MPSTTRFNHAATYDATNGLVTLATTNGDPLMIVRDYGAGHVVLFGHDFSYVSEHYSTAGALITRALVWAHGEDTVSIPVTPASTGVFSNGLWHGLVTVQTPVSEMHLRADGDDYPCGWSRSFSVLASNDLVLGLTAAPDPVAAGAELTYTFSLFNTGPFPAVAVVVSNGLPTPAVFVAVQTSQGACVREADTLICDLGDVFAEAPVTIAVTVRPLDYEPLQAWATVTRADIDAYLDNHSVHRVTTVQRPLPGELESPRLRSRRGADALVLSWPLSAVGFGLEASDTPDSTPAAWSPCLGSPVIQADSYALTNRWSGEAHFYRLRRP